MRGGEEVRVGEEGNEEGGCGGVCVTMCGARVGGVCVGEGSAAAHGRSGREAMRFASDGWEGAGT
jgi:hypothetical protein